MKIMKSNRWNAIFTNPVFIVSLINAIGAAVAFLKDVTQASFLGTSVHADAFTLAYFIPDMLGNCLIGMAIGTACVPVFSKMVAVSRLHALTRLTRKTIYQSAILSLVLFMICLLFSPEITRWLTGTDGSLRDLTYPLLLVMLPIIILYPLAMVGIAVHQSFHRFYISVSGPVIFNLIFLLAYIIAIELNLSNLNTTIIVSWGVVAGVIVMVLFVWIPIKEILSSRTKVIGTHKSTDLIPSELKRIWKVFWYFILILFAAQAVFVIERYLAARMETGAVAALNYASRLAQFPIWVYVSAFGIVILPKLSQNIALQQKIELRESILKSFHSILFVTLPTSFILLILREPIITLLFKRGAFNENSVLLTSGVLEGYALIIVCQSISAVALRYYLATETLKIPAIITLVSASASIGFDFVLYQAYGVRALGFGAAVGAFINAVGFVIILHRDLDLHSIIRPTFKLIAANIPPLILLLSFIVIRDPRDWIKSDFSLISYLAGVGLLYSSVYMLFAKWLKIIHLSKGEKLRWKIL